MSQIMNDVLHVRVDGHSQELSLEELDLDQTAGDAEIKAALVRHFDLPTGHLDRYVVERTSQAIIVRPEAVYG